MLSHADITRRRRKTGGLCVLLMLVLVAGCRELRQGVRELPADGEDLPILRQVSGTHSHETRAMQVVIRDPASLARIPLEDIEVDFSHEMILVVTLGPVTSDQFAVGIDRVWRDGHQLRVGITVVSPPPNAPVLMASPFCLAVVPRCSLNVADFAPDPPIRSRSWHQSSPPSDW